MTTESHVVGDIEFVIDPDAPRKPRVFDGCGVRRISRKEAAELVPHVRSDLRGAPLIDSWVGGMFGLAPGSVFVQDDNVPEPVTFIGNADGRRAYIVVAREYGDLSWPAWMRKQRQDARGDVARVVRAGLGDVIDWLAACDAEREAQEAREAAEAAAGELENPCPNCGLHETVIQDLGAFGVAVICDQMPDGTAKVVGETTVTIENIGD